MVKVNPPARSKSRPGDEEVSLLQVRDMTLFAERGKDNIERDAVGQFPGALILRKFRKGEKIVEQGQPGWTLFYAPSATDLRELRQSQETLLVLLESLRHAQKHFAANGSFDGAKWDFATSLIIEAVQANEDQQHSDSIHQRLEQTVEQANDERASHEQALNQLLEQLLELDSVDSMRAEYLSAVESFTENQAKSDRVKYRVGHVRRLIAFVERLRAGEIAEGRSTVLDTADTVKRLIEYIEQTKLRLDADSLATELEQVRRRERELAPLQIELQARQQKLDDLKRQVTAAAKKKTADQSQAEAWEQELARQGPLVLRLARELRERTVVGDVSLEVAGRKRDSRRAVDTPQTVCESDIFGEMSCIYRSPRSATITATRPVYLLEMMRNVYERLGHTKQFKAQMARTEWERTVRLRLRNHEFFQSLSNEQFEALEPQIRERAGIQEKAAGEIICDQFERADAAYIVLTGYVKVVVNVSSLLSSSQIEDWQGVCRVLTEPAGTKDGLKQQLQSQLAESELSEQIANGAAGKLEVTHRADVAHVLNDRLCDPKGLWFKLCKLLETGRDQAGSQTPAQASQARTDKAAPSSSEAKGKLTPEMLAAMKPAAAKQDKTKPTDTEQSAKPSAETKAKETKAKETKAKGALTPEMLAAMKPAGASKDKVATPDKEARTKESQAQSKPKAKAGLTPEMLAAMKPAKAAGGATDKGKEEANSDGSGNTAATRAWRAIAARVDESDRPAEKFRAFDFAADVKKGLPLDAVLAVVDAVNGELEHDSKAVDQICDLKARLDFDNSVFENLAPEQRIRYLNRTVLGAIFPDVIPRLQFAGPPRTVVYRGPGDYIGEIGVLDDVPRTATCIAYDHPLGGNKPGDVRLVRLSARLIKELVGQSPTLKTSLAEASKHRRNELSSFDVSLANSSHSDVPQETIDELGLVQGQQLMLIDLDRCTRCNECVQACLDTHHQFVPNERENRQWAERAKANQQDDVWAPLGYPYAYDVSRLYLDGPRAGRFMVPATCRVCTDPVCLIGCPVAAIHKGQLGETVIEDWCIGCTVCANNCPYDAIQMHHVGFLQRGTGVWFHAPSDDSLSWIDGSGTSAWVRGSTPFFFDAEFRRAMREKFSRDLCRNRTTNFVTRFRLTAQDIVADEYRIQIDSMTSGAQAWLNGKQLQLAKQNAKQPAARWKDRDVEWDYEATVAVSDRRSAGDDGPQLVVGENTLAIAIPPTASPNDVLLDVGIFALRKSIIAKDYLGEVFDYDEKILMRQAVVCDQCASTPQKTPSCVAACPHDAAWRGTIDKAPFMSSET